jgi:multidrug efflux pump
LGSVADLENVIVRVGENGEIARLGDVARVELGAAEYNVQARLNGQPLSGISLTLAPGANALSVADSVEAALKEAEKNFPYGVSYDIPYDVTKFVRLSVEEVFHTLLEAIILVVIVIFVFLHRVKATAIPTLTVPVSIVGTLAGLYLMDFSINLLTLFALVLSIGIVVDDAIVVLENAERIFKGGGMTSRQAVNQAMKEVASPVVIIVLVLCAVFIPVSFVGGLTGEMFKQFGITIALSVAISGFVALTLTPFMCEKLMGEEKKLGRIREFLNSVFEGAFAFVLRIFLACVRFFLRFQLLAVLLFLVCLGAAVLLFRTIPQGLVPAEDQGMLITMAQLPPGASMPRTAKALESLEERLRQNPHVDKVLTIAGMDLLGGAGAKGDAGVAFVILKPWDERKTPDASADAVAGYIFAQNALSPEGLFIPFSPPAIVGLGTVGGLSGYLVAPKGTPPEEMIAAGEKLSEAVAAEGEALAGLRLDLAMNVPTVRLSLNVDKAKLMGVSPPAVYEALAAGLSGAYANDAAIGGKSYKVMLQSDSKFRARPSDMDEYYVRGSSGKLVPVAELVDQKLEAGPFSLNRFNAKPAASFSAMARPGRSDLDAIAEIERIAGETLPQGWEIGWSGSSFQEKMGGGINYMALVLALVLVYIILAVHYENFILPSAVLPSIPFALLGALLSVALLGAQNDVYVQVSMVTLIGLAVKNAILLTDFSFDKMKEGVSPAEASLEAAKERFRPIVMTSLAFILGCLPLFLATGAGAAARKVLGGSIIGGMILVTVMGPIIIPALIALVMKNYKPKEHEA